MGFKAENNLFIIRKDGKSIFLNSNKFLNYQKSFILFDIGFRASKNTFSKKKEKLSSKYDRTECFDKSVAVF